MLSRNEKKRLAIEVSGIILVGGERFDWLIGIPINVTTWSYGYCCIFQRLFRYSQKNSHINTHTHYIYIL